MTDPLCPQPPSWDCPDCHDTVTAEQPHCSCDVEFDGMTIDELRAILARSSMSTTGSQ